MKIASLVAGILALSTIACVIAVLCGFPAPLEIGAAFVISSTAACSIGLLRGGSQLFGKMSSRELFVLPFFWVALVPFLFACWAVAFDWMEEFPLVRYLGIGAGFLLTLPSFYLFLRASGLTKEEPIQPPQTTTGSSAPDRV